MWSMMALLTVAAQHVHAVAITPSNSTASITTTQNEASTITPVPSVDESGITINTCSYINTTNGRTLWNSPYCSMYAGTVDLIYWPTTGNHSYPATFVDTESDYTFYSPSVYMIVNTLYGWNECGPLGPSTSRAIFRFNLDQVSTLVPYSNSQDTTTRRETRQLYLSDLGIDCDGNYNRSHLATQIAPVKDDDTRCNPFLAVPIEAKRWGYPYWKHCGIKNNKFGLFDPPYAVKPLDNLIPVTATTADTDKPKTTAASTKATAAPEPGPTKAEPSSPEPTKDSPEEEKENPVPGKTEAEGEKQTAGGNGDGQGGKTKESSPEAEKTKDTSPSTPSKDSNVGAGQGESQAGSEAENTKGASPSTPSNVEAGQGEAEPGAQGENTNSGSGSTPSENSGAGAGQDGPRPGSEGENTKPSSGSNSSGDSDANTGEDDNTNTPSGSTPSNDSDAGSSQDDSEDSDSSANHPQSPSAPGSDEDSSSSNDESNSDPKDGYSEIDPTEYSGRVVSTMTGEQIVRLGTAGLEIVDVGSGKTSTYAVPAAGVADDQTTYAPATVAVYSGTTLTLGGPEITVTGAVVVAPHGSEGSGVAKPTLAVVGTSSANRVTGSLLGLGVSLLLVFWT